MRHHSHFPKPGRRARRVRRVHLDVDDRIGHLPLLPFSLVFSQEDTFLSSLPVFQGFLPLFAHSLRIPWAWASKLIRPLNATCWAVPWRRTNHSNSLRSTSVKFNQPGFGPRMTGSSTFPRTQPSILQTYCRLSVLVKPSFSIL